MQQRNGSVERNSQSSGSGIAILFESVVEVRTGDSDE
jgi:hypothetical protein